MKDGKIVIAVGNGTLFVLIALVLGNPGLAVEPRFLTNDLRYQNRPDMVIEMEKLLKKKPIQHWIDSLNEEGAPCAPINTIGKLLDLPQLLSRDIIVQHQGQAPKPLKTAGNSIKMTEVEDLAPTKPLSPSRLGQHTEGIIDELMSHHKAYDLTYI